MLDVHPPHHAATTWRDFFIHIATIVIGLLIAIGLEQSVEALHHRDQRNSLEEHLHIEAEQNQIYVQREIQLSEAYFDWAVRSAAEARTAGPKGPLHLPRFPPSDMWIPDTGVYLSAKDNGTISLLSSGEQVWYTDLYRMEARCFVPGIGAYDRLRASLAQIDDLLGLGVAARADGPAIELSDLTSAQRDKAAQLLVQVSGAARDLDYELINYDSANQYLLNTPPALWSNPTGISIYTRIYQQNFARHPKSRYTFNSK